MKQLTRCILSSVVSSDAILANTRKELMAIGKASLSEPKQKRTRYIDNKVSELCNTVLEEMAHSGHKALNILHNDPAKANFNTAKYGRNTDSEIHYMPYRNKNGKAFPGRQMANNKRIMARALRDHGAKWLANPDWSVPATAKKAPPPKKLPQWKAVIVPKNVKSIAAMLIDCPTKAMADAAYKAAVEAIEKVRKAS